MTDIQLKKALFRLPNGTYITPYTDCKGALDVGDIGQALHVDESQGLRRVLNGQTVAINANTQNFVNRLKTLKQVYPALFCTEDEWQDIKNSNYMEQCGKFVIQEDSTQTREQYNIGFLGVLNRSHGIVSDFLNNTNSLVLQESLPWDTATSIEAVFKLDVTSISVANVLFGTTGDAPQGLGMVCRTDTTNVATRLRIWATTNGTSWTTSSADTGIDLEIGTNYIKLEYDGANVIVSKLVDGVWVAGNTIATGVITASKQWIGSTGSGNAFYLRGSIDLSESYIKVNGDMWCKPFEYITETVEPYVRLPRVTVSVGTLNYENLNKIGLSNRLLVYTRKPSADNNFTWCNVYADGWVEQGGAWNSSNGEGTSYRTYTVYFPRPFNNTNYTAIAMSNYTGGDLYAPHANDRQPERITFYYVHEQNYTGASWFAAGWSNIPEPDEYNVESTDAQFPYFIQIAQSQHTMRTIRNDWEINNPYTIFDAKQSQYPLNNTSWLKSLGQWNEKTVYTYAYEALLVELNNSIETNTTVDLPSGGIYTKHLQTVNFNVNKVVKIGNPVIEEGILTPSNTDYVQLKVGENILDTAKSWQLDLLCQISSNYIVATDYDNGYVPFAINNSNLIINNSLNTFSTIAEGWKYLRVKFNDSTGYEVYTSDDGNTFDLITSVETEDKVDYADNNLNLKGTPVDLRTVQFKYDLGDGVEHLVTTGVEYKSAVWNKAEHTTSEADYAYNFIVDIVNESFRLPLYDRVFNNPYAELYYYIGDTLQNTSLIDIGRLSEAVTVNKSEIEQLRTLISKIAGDVPTVETSTHSFKNVTIYNGTDLGDHVIDLSSYIPLDGHEYDVYLYTYLNVGYADASNHNVVIYNQNKTNVLHRFSVDGVAIGGSSTQNNGNFSYTCCIPLPTNSRTIVHHVDASSDKQFSQYYIQLVWFRKY